MNEVKTPKKPLIVYYAIAILVVLLINTLLVPMVSQARVKYVDYGTFIQMTEEDKISEVQVQDNQIIFVTKEDEANKNAVYYRTGKMDDPELTSRLSAHDVRFDKEIVEETSPLLSFLLSFVFPIVLFIALGQLLTRQLMKRMGGAKDAIGIAAIDTLRDDTDGLYTAYTLSGARLLHLAESTSSLPNGMYIINGKKTLTSW